MSLYSGHREVVLKVVGQVMCRCYIRGWRGFEAIGNGGFRRWMTYSFHIVWGPTIFTMNRWFFLPEKEKRKKK